MVSKHSVRKRDRALRTAKSRNRGEELGENRLEIAMTFGAGRFPVERRGARIFELRRD